ncbi:Fic family protein [Gemmatimonas sp.]|uniref:Fic family protein n=1 Tax=Gemmatimonas sp. TaxID=1962908 RepID=UPI0025BA6F92|nr:Fic family protein [Gemmatimonas sp.]MCA2985335.1 Fic family protein [Gemmatimonas sp.]MCA2989226.1 Fic family protein [Gemmatimonas sp.]MCA2996338.1 Fic family protein [Gemmatimonas sp.]
MLRGPTGTWRTETSSGEAVRAFIPAPLPPVPPLQLDAIAQSNVDDSLLALGRLDSVALLMPDTRLFLYAYVRKEAVLSSQIEGTQSSLSDLLTFEADESPGVPLDDVTEVSNYVAALEWGMAEIRRGFPISGRLLRGIHGRLLSSGRGADKLPGDFRRSQNWIGGTRPGNAAFVPPPPSEVAPCISALERFIHDDPVRTSPVLKAALAHVQFETIHPFLDGNGRVGRLLITLLLCAEGVLKDPMLYLSLYFKEHRAEYYAHLTAVRETGDWEAWIAFFADGVRETASAAVDTAQRLVALFARDRERIASAGRTANSLLRVFDALRERPISTAAMLSERSGASLPTTNRMLEQLRGLGIVTELTGRKRDRLFSYAEYVRILSEGTSPL